MRRRERRRPLVPPYTAMDEARALRRYCRTCGASGGAECVVKAGIAGYRRAGRVHAVRWLDPMLEKPLQRGVEDLFKRHGFEIFHRRDPDRSDRRSAARSGEGRGFPYLIAGKGDRIVVAELKRDGEPLTEAQVGWLDCFARSGAETFAWATRHYNLGSIELVAAGYTFDEAAELVGRWEVSA